MSVADAYTPGEQRAKQVVITQAEGCVRKRRLPAHAQTAVHAERSGSAYDGGAAAKVSQRTAAAVASLLRVFASL